MAWYLDGFLDRREGGTEVVGGIHKWVIECNWKFAAEQFCSDQYHAPFTHGSAVQVLQPVPTNKPDGAPLGEGQTAKPAWANGLGGVQFAGNGHGSAFFFTEKPDANVWGGRRRFDLFPRDVRGNRAAARPGAGAAPRRPQHHVPDPLLAERHPDAAHLASAGAEPDRGVGVLHRRQGGARRGEGSAQAEPRPRLRPGRLPGAGRFRDTRVEVQKVLRGHVAKQTDMCVQMGLGFEERRTDGIPGLTNHTFAETAARGFYQRWVDMMTAESWDEIERLNTSGLKEAVNA